MRYNFQLFFNFSRGVQGYNNTHPTPKASLSRERERVIEPGHAVINIR